MFLASFRWCTSLRMASAAHAETLDSNWIDPTYQDPKEVATSSDLGYLLFFFAISVVAIARDVFSKSDSKSLKDATWQLKWAATDDWQCLGVSGGNWYI